MITLTKTNAKRPYIKEISPPQIAIDVNELNTSQNILNDILKYPVETFIFISQSEIIFDSSTLFNGSTETNFWLSINNQKDNYIWERHPLCGGVEELQQAFNSRLYGLKGINFLHDNSHRFMMRKFLIIFKILLLKNKELNYIVLNNSSNLTEEKVNEYIKFSENIKNKLDDFIDILSQSVPASKLNTTLTIIGRIASSVFTGATIYHLHQNWFTNNQTNEVTDKIVTTILETAMSTFLVTGNWITPAFSNSPRDHRKQIANLLKNLCIQLIKKLESYKMRLVN